MNSPAAFNDIFNLKANVRKSPWYDALIMGPKNMSTLSATDRNIHTQKRRILNSVFSDKAIRSAETFILKHVDRWNQLMLEDDGKDWGPPRDFAVWADYLVFDILGDLAFGSSFETKEPQENSLKAIPHAISASLKVLNPVRITLRVSISFTNSSIRSNNLHSSVSGFGCGGGGSTIFSIE